MREYGMEQQTEEESSAHWEVARAHDRGKREKISTSRNVNPLGGTFLDEKNACETSENSKETQPY